MGAHHAFYGQGLFHSGLLLLNCIFLRCGLHKGGGQGRDVFGRVVTLCAVQVKQVQSQGVAHHAEAGKAHGSCTEHGVQRQPQGNEHTGCQRNADDVIDERPEQVFMDVTQGSAAQPDGGGHIRELGVHQHYVRSVNGHIRACADGNAGVSSGQGRGVVDAVAHHGYLAVLLQLPDNGLLALRQHPGDHLVHTGLPADGFSGALVVTGQHHYPDAHVPQLPDGLRAVLLDGICHRDNTQQTTCAAKEEGRFTLRSQCSSPRLQRSRDSDLCANKSSVAAKDLLTLQLGGKAVARQGGKIGDRGQRQLLFLRIGQHCPRQRVLAAALQRGCQCEQFGLGHARSGQQVGDSGLAAGDGAGLVQCHDAGTPGLLQRRSGLEQDAVFRTQAVAHHDSHRRCKSQRTGAADDQH